MIKLTTDTLEAYLGAVKIYRALDSTKDPDKNLLVKSTRLLALLAYIDVASEEIEPIVGDVNMTSLEDILNASFDRIVGPEFITAMIQDINLDEENEIISRIRLRYLYLISDFITDIEYKEYFSDTRFIDIMNEVSEPSDTLKALRKYIINREW